MPQLIERSVSDLAPFEHRTTSKLGGKLERVMGEQLVKT